MAYTKFIIISLYMCMLAGVCLDKMGSFPQKMIYIRCSFLFEPPFPRVSWYHLVLLFLLRSTENGLIIEIINSCVLQAQFSRAGESEWMTY